MRTTVLPKGGSESQGVGPPGASTAPPSITPSPKITPRPVAVPPGRPSAGPPPARVTPRPASLPRPVTGSAGAPPARAGRGTHSPWRHPSDPRGSRPPTRRWSAVRPTVAPPQSPAPALVPTPPLALPLPARPPGSRRSGGGVGAGLALLGLSAAVGAWLWQRYGSVPREPAPLPTTSCRDHAADTAVGAGRCQRASRDVRWSTPSIAPRGRNPVAPSSS